MEEIIDEKHIDKELVKSIKEHAKKYDETPNKREFLKGISAYEQKVVLLTTSHPCDVLRYLSEFDTKTTKLVLDSLDSGDILNILEKFTLDDKSWFYEHFPNMEVVNKFITHDDSSKSHVEALPLERKVEILATSTKETHEASKEVYNSLSDSDMKEISNNDTIPDNVVDKINELHEEKNNSEAINVENIIPVVAEVVDELTDKIDDTIEEQLEETKEEPKEVEEPKQEEQLTTNNQELVNNNPESLEEIANNNEQVLVVENEQQSMVDEFRELAQTEELKEIEELSITKENSTLQR